MHELNELYERIKLITDTNLVNLVHAQEELGELATEVLIDEGLVQKVSEEGIFREGIDVIVCVLAIFAKRGYTLNPFLSTMDEKISKWEMNLEKRKNES